ncbi:MAG: serine/threonine-protein kinase [Planctomycetota bacterium]
MTRMPAQIGPYRVDREIGRGGMGIVYLARDARLDRDVAIKCLPDEVSADHDRLARFEREAKTLATLSHPGIAVVYGLDEADGRHFLILEYIDGVSLRARLGSGPMPCDESIRVAADVAEALEAAHARGVVHRDIKPDNVMLTADGRVKVLDFGLAKRAEQSSADAMSTVTVQTRPGAIMGTLPYMSPEQVEGAEVDHRTDLFSLGVLLFELVTGSLPFKGSSPAALMTSILRDPPGSMTSLAPGVPASLAAIVERCLAKAPGQRYPSARELADDLRGVLRGDAVVAPPRRTRPLVGREIEHATLLRALENARQGSGALILLGGEPGVGKTHLVQDVLDHAGRLGLLAVSGHAYEEERAPYIISGEILEELIRRVPPDDLRELLGESAPELSRILPALRTRFPDIPPPAELPPEQQRRYLFNCVLEFLVRACSARPMVMLLDDLHWADESSLLLLEHISQHLDAVPLLLLGTYRDVELDVGKPFERTLARLVRQKLAQRMPIRRLSEDGVGALFEALGGADPPPTLVAAIYRESEGNPFFATELFEHLAEEGLLFDETGAWREDAQLEGLEVPEGVRLVIGRRLEHLSDDTRPVLTTAAVIGHRFELTTLTSVVAGDEDAVLDAIDEAVSARLLTPLPERRVPRYEFVHALVRHTLLGALSLPRRQRLHLKVADALEQAVGDAVGARAAELAHHLYQAGGLADPVRTRQVLVLAGQASLDAASADEALSYLDRAMELLEFEEHPEPTERAELLWRRGRASRALGRWEDAARDWREALAALEAEGRTDAVAGICRDLAFEKIWENDPEGARSLVARGLEVVGDTTSAGHCRLLAILGYALSVGGRLAESWEVHERAAAMAEAIRADESMEGEVLLQRAYFFQHGNCPRLMAETAGRAVALARRVGHPWELSTALGAQLFAWLHSARFAEIEATIDEALALARRTGDLGSELHYRIIRGFACFARGELGAGRESVVDAADFCRTTSFPWTSIVEAYIGLADFYCGSWDSARLRLDDAAAHGVSGAWGDVEMAHRLFALAYVDPDEARAVLAASAGRLPAGEGASCVGRQVLAGAVADAAAWLGQRDVAADRYALLQQMLDEGGYLCSTLGLTHRLAGTAAAAGRRFDLAERHFGEALRQVEASPYALDRPETLRWQAWSLLERGEPGDRERADALLDGARDEYLRLGMTRHGEIVAELLERTR